ncbi:unnamed protein product [Acanthoscelides obtectus]|uniref:DDE Tnp4 domain-containing protein n=1 Tax=Acanthoscelides obtectus TaxID=200917 RepID=A0A9P0JXL4_ACAOB|nr:unnamed protein product [Acanthoscelides obtectus]CAK1663682.1 hypothetical protein AOBTE_LOCUS23797 [Acanthoscelides obtectus]
MERCFGQLKQRFPILHNKIRIDTEKVPSLVMSCLILHNVAKHLNDEDFAVDWVRLSLWLLECNQRFFVGNLPQQHLKFKIYAIYIY